MTERPSRPRATLGAALALVGATLSLVGAVTLPLALLLAGARPTTRRLQLWAAIALVLTAGWMGFVGTADPYNLLTFFTAIVSGTLFALLMRSGPRPALESSLLATGAAVAVAVAGVSALGFDVASSRTDFILTALQMADPQFTATIGKEGLPLGLLLAFADAGFVLSFVVGHCTVWHWYRILVDAPELPAPVPFAEFRFSDHLVWLLLLGLLGVVAQIGGVLPAERTWPGALLAVMASLYLTRGLAVVWPRDPKIPTPLLLGVGVTVLFLGRLVPTFMVLTLSGLLGLGVADNWLDFRRRAAQAADASGE